MRPLSIRNQGTAAWPAGDRFAVASHWLGHDGEPVVWDGARTPLPRAVAPGEELTLEVAVRAPQQPGRYRLQWDMVHEGVAWFSERDPSPDPARTVLVVASPLASPLAWAVASLAAAALVVVAARGGRSSVWLGLAGVADLLWCGGALLVKQQTVLDRAGHPAGWRGLLLAAAGAAVLLLPALPLRRRLRAWCCLALAGLATALLFADLLYERFFGDLLTVALAGAASQVGEVGASVASLLEPGDAWFWVDLVAGAVIAAAVARIPDRVGRRATAVTAAALVATLAVGAVTTVTWLRSGGHGLGQVFRNIALAREVGVLNFHAVDGGRALARRLWRPALEPAEVDRLAAWFAERAPLRAGTGPWFGAAEGANLLMVQAESLQGFVLGLEVEGQEVTPFLNRWATQALLFRNTTDQTAQGRSSDAELLTQVSLLPPPAGAAAFLYPNNRFTGLASALDERGYTTVSAVAFDGAFWNRRRTHPSFGFTTSLFGEAFAGGEVLGWGLNDRDFFRQMVGRFADGPQPFCALLLTLSLHHPFEGFPAHLEELELGELQGTALGSYLHTMRFFDRAFAELVAGLERTGLAERTVMALWGDHDAGLEWTQQLAAMTGRRHDAAGWYLSQTVPLLVRVPGWTGRIVGHAGGAPGRGANRARPARRGPRGLPLRGPEPPRQPRGRPGGRRVPVLAGRQPPVPAADGKARGRRLFRAARPAAGGPGRLRRRLRGGPPPGRGVAAGARARPPAGDPRAAARIRRRQAVSETRRGTLDGLLLFRLERRLLDAVLTAAIAALLLWSRFGLLATGPWEWDEVLFARGLLHFELAAHFPHPPGFPGWLAIGHLLMPLAGDPLRALQWGSSLLSVAALWPLAALGRKVAHPAVAVAAALLVMVAPGPWLYAVRGFSSTPAAAFALLAAALAAGGLAGRRATAFTLLVAAAFLIRPILLPGLVALWLVGAATVRPRRRLLEGLAGAAAMVAIAVLAMVRAEGGWSAFVQPFLAHSDKHFSRLDQNLGGVLDLGLVKGLGGGVPAALLLAAALLGLGVWARRRGRRSALAWALVLGVTVVQLVALQNRSYARYAVPVQLALAPLIAAAAGLLPPALATGGLLAGAAALGAAAHPLLEEQHTTHLPGWQAVLVSSELAMDRGMAVVVEPELHPFASYRWHLLEREGVRPPPLVLSPWAPEPWAGVDRPYLVATVHRHLYLEPLAGGELEWSGVSDALTPLTQQRFLEAWVLGAPALPLGEWWPVETSPDGGSFQWGGAHCELVLPPLPPGTTVTAAFRLAQGPSPLSVAWNGRYARQFFAGGLPGMRFGPPLVRGDAANRLAFDRERGYPPGPDDSRPLSVQLLSLAARGPALAWSGPVASPAERERLGVRIDGHYLPETFGEAGQGVWLAPSARLEMPAGPGRIGLTLLAPRPTPSRTVARVAGREAAGPVDFGPAPSELWIAVGDGDVTDGMVVVELHSEAFRPSDHGRPRRPRARRGPDPRPLRAVRGSKVDPPALLPPLRGIGSGIWGIGFAPRARGSLP